MCSCVCGFAGLGVGGFGQIDVRGGAGRSAKVVACCSWASVRGILSLELREKVAAVRDKVSTVKTISLKREVG